MAKKATVAGVMKAASRSKVVAKGVRPAPRGKSSNPLNISDPGDDPTLARASKSRVKGGKVKAEAGPIAGLTLAQRSRAPEPKVSPRGVWEVLTTVAGHTYQFEVDAVDESEAITRVLDSAPNLKPLANQCRHQVTLLEPAPEPLNTKAVIESSEDPEAELKATTMPHLPESTGKLEPAEMAPPAKRRSARVAAPARPVKG